MSSPEQVLDVLRAEMRTASITYKDLATRIGVSESSVKRMFGQKDMALSRLAQICQVTGIAMEDVLRRAADARPQADALTLPQETSLVANPRLLLMAICCLGHWSLEGVIETYRPRYVLVRDRSWLARSLSRIQPPHMVARRRVGTRPTGSARS